MIALAFYYTILVQSYDTYSERGPFQTWAQCQQERAIDAGEGITVSECYQR